jgi:hypothetical protein
LLFSGLLIRIHCSFFSQRPLSGLGKSIMPISQTNKPASQPPI